MMAFNNLDNDQILEFIDEQEDWKGIKLSEDRESLLHIGIYSSNYNICKSLLKRKADIDAKNKEGHTPLHSACIQKADCKYIALLMNHGADPTLRDNFGKTPLHYIRCVASLNVILKEYNKNEDTNKVDLLNMDDKNGNTPLMD